MTTHEFISAWEEAASHLRHTARLSENVPDLDDATLDNLRRALLIALDVLTLARKANARALP